MKIKICEVFIILLFSCSSICNNHIINQVVSSDNKYIAMVFVRDCGATTASSTQVSIIDNGKELSNVPGNIFSSDANYGAISINKEGGPDVVVSWTENNTLLIQYPIGTRIFLNKTNYRELKVKYKMIGNINENNLY